MPLQQSCTSSCSWAGARAHLLALDDLGRQAQPGYPTIGRLKGLAELRGIMKALEHPEFGLH